MGNHPSKTASMDSLPASLDRHAVGHGHGQESVSKGSQKWKNRLSVGKMLTSKTSNSKLAATAAAANGVGAEAEYTLEAKKEEPGRALGVTSSSTVTEALAPPSSTATNSSSSTHQPSSTSASSAVPPVVTVTEHHNPPPPQTQQNQQPPQLHIKTPVPPSTMTPAAVTVPCQYRTGKTLGSGTYAVVKEAIHIKTGKYYACKVISKKLMEGREYMVRNEIAVLKRVSVGHRNIVTLHDYFETAHNLYLVFDLCTGGELFDRICAKGNYFEADAAALVRTVLGAVEYIHSQGIVHRDLKPENLLFREKAEDADIMIADFGLSRVMPEDKLQMLTEICGTPGYMAPEIFKKCHGKPVDIWAMGVITYFLLCGYTPFDRDTQEQETKAICSGDYKFEPEEYWQNVSQTARNFVKTCLTIDPAERPTATELLKHEWLASETPYFVADTTGQPTNLLPTIQKGFNARKTFRKAVLSMMAVRKMSMMTSENKLSNLSPSAQELASNINKYLEDSEKEVVDGDNAVVHQHTDDGNGGLGVTGDSKTLLSPTDVNAPPLTPVVQQLKVASITK